MSSRNIAIVIVNWNGQKLLNNCLKAVYSQSYPHFKVYLVDNGSEDDSVGFVKENFPKTEIVKLNENTGYAKGNNIGIKMALKENVFDFIICLNNDTIVSKGWLKELTNTADKDTSIGAVSSKAYFDDKKTIQNAGLEFYKSLKSTKQGGISIGYGLTDNEAPELSHDIEVFAPGGVAPLYKTEVLKKLLLRDNEVFDEDFFAYAEDYDLGFRIRSFGYKCFLSSKATLIHLHSKTGGVASPLKVYYGERNSMLIAIKNLPIIDLMLYPFRNIAIKCKFLFIKNKSAEKLKGNIGYNGVILLLIKANFSALLLLPKFLKKRWRINNKLSLNNDYNINNVLK